MKVSLLQAIVTQVKTVTELSNRAYLYSPTLDLNTLTWPFAVVRSITDMEKIVSFDQAKEADYYLWVYAYPEPNEYKALNLPEAIKVALFNELNVEIEIGEDETLTYKTMPIYITVNRLNGVDNDLEKYGSVITCIYKIYS